jgi:hypothetical protein
MKDDTLLRKYNPKKAKSQHKSEPTAIGDLFGDIFDKKKFFTYFLGDIKENPYLCRN